MNPPTIHDLINGKEKYKLPASTGRLLMKNDFVKDYEARAGDKAIDTVYVNVGEGFLSLHAEDMKEIAMFRDFGKGLVMSYYVTIP
jgi:hypothetical protein